MPVSNRSTKQCTRCFHHRPSEDFLDAKNRERRLCLRCRQVRSSRVDIRTEKRCPTCKETKPISEFCSRGNESNPNKIVWHRCRSCNATICNGRMRRRIASGEAREDYKKRYKTRRWDKLLKEYGITQEEYNELEAHQEYTCAICKEPETAMYKDVKCRLVVDHNHVTGVIRGLLCRACNIALGNFREDPKRLQSAIEYLRLNGN